MKRNTQMEIVFVALCLALPFPGTAFARVFDVKDFGAKGDGVSKDTVAIQKAIDAAAAEGGGTVELGAGTYLTGSLFLKSNVDFFVAGGAVVKASPDKADYNAPDVCPQNSKGYSPESVTGQHLFLCIEQRNVTVRGPGKIDGNSEVFMINPETQLPWGHPKGKVTPKHVGQNAIPFRPAQMLYFVDSTVVRIQDIELVNSSYWNVFFHGCERVFVKGAYIHNEKKRFHTHNGDGIDIDGCRFVTVSDCQIDTADDCITLRASHLDKLKSKTKDCAYVTVANCILSTPCNAVRVGVGTGDVHDCTFSNVIVHDARTAVNFVSGYTRGGGCTFHNIRFVSWVVDCEKFLHFYPGYSVVMEASGVSFCGFSGRASGLSELIGLDTKPLKDILFRDIDLACEIKVTNAEDVKFENCKLVQKQ